MHGRIGNTPAEEVCHCGTWKGGVYEMQLSGKMREGVLYEEALELKRTITVKAGEIRSVSATRWRIKERGKKH